MNDYNLINIKGIYNHHHLKLNIYNNESDNLQLYSHLTNNKSRNKSD